jgi:transketolase
LSDLINSCRKIRAKVLELSNFSKSSHAGSALSCVEIISTIFWLKYKGRQPISKFVLSKGHAAMTLYSAALEFQLIQEEQLSSYLNDYSPFWGHPSVSENFDFIYWSTGSLGHGLPACTGFAYYEKYLQPEALPPQFVVAIVSDGELDEGSNWEALLFANHHQLNRLIVIVDFNKIQSFGRCDEIMSLEPLDQKIKAFGFHCVQMDGHDTNELLKTLQSHMQNPERPLFIIAHTVKGKGVPSIEDTLESHYKPITNDQLGSFNNEK